ncbi:MAG: hypothetical protein EBU93_03295 [Chlamydiae bacterium]|jgi:hypothetical protein|nr:hypothetical protein [Chlamydiota bacterium]
MFNHLFLFQPGCWIGEGKIQLNGFDDQLVFFTRWKTLHIDPDFREFEASQEVQIAGHTDMMFNHFLFTQFNQKKFEVILENQTWGEVKGVGMVDDKFIGWEFRDTELGFEGYEYYELQDDATYTMKAEYVSKDELRTLIEGKIWKQLAKTKSEMQEKQV